MDRTAIGLDRIAGNGAGPDVRSVPTSQGGRGVLEGAFELLDVLSRMPSGAGLSGLSRDSGLPKATTHRLLEQLVALGAVQRDGQRYYVGGALARLGRSWQP
ncbi:MAG: IclR family transcriptional regulator, acetate operon repressor, partial [Pseudonocardiales bacterium]|nr:IclR family transcriptional regulator, acetate operon repressor [Pseudonocardiales bacterium]